MLWKLFFILTFTDYILSYNEPKRRYALEEILEEAYSTSLEVDANDGDDDVGEPLLLTPYIENKNLTVARQEALVDDKVLLPGITSYSGYLTIGEQLYSALQQFLTIFPELRKAPLFIAGENYGGKHALSLGIQIHRNKNHDEAINLQGLAIGNGIIDPYSMLQYSHFAREVSLVHDGIGDIMRMLEFSAMTAIENKNMMEALDVFYILLGIFVDNSHLPNFFNYNDVGPSPSIRSFVGFVTSNKMRRALHVGHTKFSNFIHAFISLMPDLMNSAKSWLEELLNHYDVLLYNGQLDCLVPYHVSVNLYNSLKFSGENEYKLAKRHLWFHDDILFGQYKSVGNFTEVMVRLAGHMVPVDVPHAALGLISAFVRGISLEHDTKHIFDA